MSAQIQNDSDDTNGTVSTDDPPAILTDHARERWLSRVCNVQRGAAPWDLHQAFEAAIPVDAATTTPTKFYAPTSSAFLYKTGRREVLLTVVPASGYAIHTELVACEECGLDHHPEDEECPWCQEVDHV